MSIYLGYSRPCSPPLKDTFSAFKEKQEKREQQQQQQEDEDEEDGLLPLSPLDTSSTESYSPPASHCDGSFLLKDEPNDLFSNYLQIPNETDWTQDSKSLLKIKVLGIPETGAKSRVETQIKLCIQLVDNDDKKVTDYSFVRLQNTMLARSRLKKLQQQQNNGTLIVATDSKVLDLEAKVVTSRTDQPIRMCVGCVRRERKRAERTKDKSSVDELPTTMEEERDRILIFNCNPMINFNSGDAILPTRITCYCRHHDEKLGFRVCFVMRNDKGEMVASGLSAPILITDDHKSSKKKKENNNNNNRKRARSIDNNSNHIQQPPDTPLHTPKSEKTDIIPLSEHVDEQHGVSNMFQPNNNELEEEEDWPFNRRRRTDTKGRFVTASLPTTPLTEKDEFALLSDFITYNNNNNNNNYILPFTPSTTTFIPPSSSSVLEQSTSTSTSTSSSSLSLSSLSSSALLQQQQQQQQPSVSITSAIASSPFLSILNEPMMPPPPPTRVPQIDRLVPSQGPIYGGTEVSILGSGFYQGLSCVFGEQLATTLYWSENTMVCLLPPASVPGPVVVSFKQHSLVLEQNEICIFTYYDASDQALLELALQLVGMKSTGKLQDAKQVAMGIIIQGKNVTNTTTTHGQTMLHLLVLLDYTDLVKAWIDKDLDLDTQDLLGMTPLHLACQLGAFEMVKLLIEAGADTSIKNKDGYLPSFFIPSHQEDHADIKELLPPPPPKRKSLSRRSSMKGSHLMHRFHSLTKETEVEETTAPTMESDGLGFVQPKLDKRLYLFWLPVLIVAIGLLFVQLMGHPTLLEPLLDKMPSRLSFSI